ncbi:unnamed protein product [marine sediment metagenome]|uniref:Uncharacterized protein n=1 Tax=marine sediment metagenome TaxID=412755 RepID=X0T739_9ZZZZ
MDTLIEWCQQNPIDTPEFGLFLGIVIVGMIIFKFKPPKK